MKSSWKIVLPLRFKLDVLKEQNIVKRSSLIDAFWLDKVVLIPNGNFLTKRTITEKMLNERFGSFSLTRKRHIWRK